MKKKSLFTFAICSLLFCSCSSKEIKQLENKPFNGRDGGLVLIEKEKFKSAKLIFKAPSMISPNSSLKDRDEKKEKYEKAQKREYKDVKIEKKDNKKFITAKDFKYKLVLIDENTIEDLDDGEVYRFVNLHKK